MKTFSEVARLGSFAGASAAMGVAVSVISKRIKDLEQHLDSRLFYRTTRKISLSETGQTYLEFVNNILDQVEEVERLITHKSQHPVGTIKLTAPLSFGIQRLGPVLSDFLKTYPDVNLSLSLSDRTVDIIEEGFDLAIRVGTLKDSSLISRKLSSNRLFVCASPDYLKNNGTPTVPSDLAQHNCMIYTNSSDGKSWAFRNKGKRVLQPVSGRLQSDNGDLLCNLAIHDCGIVLLPSFIAGKAVKEGKLKVILEKYEEPELNIHAIYPSRHHISPKIRILIDHLAHHL